MDVEHRSMSLPVLNVFLEPLEDLALFFGEGVPVKLAEIPVVGKEPGLLLGPACFMDFVSHRRQPRQADPDVLSLDGGEPVLPQLRCIRMWSESGDGAWGIESRRWRGIPERKRGAAPGCNGRR